ncbi:dUTP diphosphatase [Halobacillus seohaensis]|uniref:dUTP diphosphatase n=1 Tax=Halobacillus seohaensis TaxID=447421 RepID=A0ABW2EGW0_9BACI
MNWQNFYQRQEQLDKHIMETQGLKNASVTDEKILALLVEIGELANETRCFKFWSTKAASPKSVILEEYVDGLHFILSLGLDLNFYYNSVPINDRLDQTEAFLDVFTSIEDFKQNKSNSAYDKLFHSYIKLGKSLGISEEELQEAYQKKNNVNFQRQDQGY